MWFGIAVIVAALITGLLVSLLMTNLGWPYLACFAVSVLAVTATVDLRGVFLTVVSTPPLFAVFTVVTSWAVNHASASENAPAFSRTAIVTAVYPFTQHFPTLFIVTAVAALIAWVRLWRTRREAKAATEQAIVTRRATAEADRRNRAAAARARERTGRLSVAELVARNQKDAIKNKAASAAVSPTFATEEGNRRGGLSPKDREVRRREQAAQRAGTRRAQQRAEHIRGGEPRASQRRRYPASPRIPGEQRPSAYRGNDSGARPVEGPARPDPNRRAGDSPSLSSYVQPAPRQPSSRTYGQQRPQTPSRSRHSLDEDIYRDH